MPTEAVEDYLKAIYELGEEKPRVTIARLAGHLRIAPPSVSAMLKRLGATDPPLVAYDRSRGARLTADGREMALHVLRRHRLIELFLCDVLGLTWDTVHEEAEQLEHALSSRVEERLFEFLGRPKLDPHGDPIPTKEGTVVAPHYTPLGALEAGQRARVRRVTVKDPDALRHLTALGVTPETVLEVTRKEPFDGPVFVRIEGAPAGAEQVLGSVLSQAVLVEPLE